MTHSDIHPTQNSNLVGAGSDTISISEEPIHVQHWMSAVTDPLAGAVSSFVGMTRQDPFMKEPHHSHQNKKSQSCGSCDQMSASRNHNHDENKNLVVTGLQYEAYIPMAEKVIRELLVSLRQKYPSVLHTAVIHRLGLVRVQEPSILIAMSSPHRYDALHAVTDFLDEFKAKVPIWKKEIYSEDVTVWKANAECTSASMRLE